MINEDLISRINKVISFLGLTSGGFAVKCGLMPSNMKYMLEGAQTITNRTLHKIADAFPQISLEWLKTGQGEMLKKEETKMEQSNSGGNNQQIQRIQGNAKVENGTTYNICPEDKIKITTLEKENSELSLKLGHAESQLESAERIIREKDIRIAEKDERIAELKEIIADLKAR